MLEMRMWTQGLSHSTVWLLRLFKLPQIQNKVESYLEYAPSSHSGPVNMQHKKLFSSGDNNQGKWWNHKWYIIKSHISVKLGCAYVLSCSVMSDSLWPCRLKPTRLLYPWDSPGKNTGMGCHFILQGIFPTLGSNSCLLSLLHWDAGSSPLCHLGSPP